MINPGDRIVIELTIIRDNDDIENAETDQYVYEVPDDPYMSDVELEIGIVAEGLFCKLAKVHSTLAA